jgi:hypothetical protein
MMHTKYDQEIKEVEARLTYEREALVHGAEDLTHTAKRMAASPKGLLAAFAVGFLVGEFTRPKRRRSERSDASAAPKAVGLGGVLGGVALALIRAQFGSPLGMGRAALEYAAARRRARAEAAAAATGHPTSAAGYPVSSSVPPMDPAYRTSPSSYTGTSPP